MILRAKSALLFDFAERRTKTLLFCGAKYKGFVILRSKVCIAFKFFEAGLKKKFAEQRTKFKGNNTALSYIFVFPEKLIAQSML